MLIIISVWGMIKVRGIIIKNRTYYFFNDMISIKNFDLNNSKIDEKSYNLLQFTYLLHCV